MRLFRQKEQGDWDEVLQRVAEAINQEFPSNASASKRRPEKPTNTKKTSAKLQIQQPLQGILSPISLGELIDKITILQIKIQHLKETALENVEKELAALQVNLDALNLKVEKNLIERLREVNADLWQIEDDIREKERQQDFGESFIRLARSVYQQNDRRSQIKKEINDTYGSDIVEEKSYKEYWVAYVVICSN